MSRVFHHINWARLASVFSSRFSSRYGSSKGKSSGSDAPNKGRKARYADLEDRVHGPALHGYETPPVKLMRTYVRTGRTDDVEEDGIHLQYDIEQERSQS